MALAVLAAFATAAAVAGVSMALNPACTSVCETTGFTLYGAGLPISVIFAATAGELPVALPLDLTAWVTVSALVSRYAERRRMTVLAAAVRVMVLALIYGFIASQFIESVDF